MYLKLTSRQYKKANLEKMHLKSIRTPISENRPIPQCLSYKLLVIQFAF
jgi:hypothetical protein